MIRSMEAGDLEQIVRLFAEVHSRSVYRQFKPNFQTALQKTAYLMSSPNGFVRVADHDGKVTGIIVCMCEEFWWVEDKVGAKYASDLLFFSKRRGDGVLMLKEAIEWAWSRPRVVCFETANSSGIEHRAADAMYRGAGLALHGSIWRITNPKLEK